MAPGGLERVPGWLMMAMRGVRQPTSEPQEGFWRALGGLWDVPGRARAGARMVHEAHGTR